MGNKLTTLSVLQLCVTDTRPDLMMYIESPGSPSLTTCSPASKHRILEIVCLCQPRKAIEQRRMHTGLTCMILLFSARSRRREGLLMRHAIVDATTAN